MQIDSFHFSTNADHFSKANLETVRIGSGVINGATEPVSV